MDSRRQSSSAALNGALPSSTICYDGRPTGADHAGDWYLIRTTLHWLSDLGQRLLLLQVDSRRL